TFSISKHLISSKTILIYFYYFAISLLTVHNDTALLRAVLYGRTDIVKYLLDQGTEIYVKDRLGYNPLHEVVYYTFEANKRNNEESINNGIEIFKLFLS
ncbi:MAG: ankyrin repeat domain-containing protein, partial [Rickettsiales bacterium]